MKKQRHFKKEPQPVQKVEPPSYWKRAGFTLIMIASPFIFLGMVELCLRLANYHSETNSLVVVKRFQGKEYYCINTNIGKNYFASHNVGVPEPYEEIFEVKKSPETFRVFCLGESTMYGYPYPSNIAAARFLKERLKTLFPEKNIEVINMGIPAVSSFVVLDLLKQTMEYSPDIFIIYSGHNEFYGTYGVASTEFVGYNKSLLDFYMHLRKFKLVQLLRDGIDTLRTFLHGSEPQTRRATFLERMVEDRYIPYGNPKYERAKELFRQNLIEMAELAAKNKVPICFSTLVSNWKDQYPFISSYSPNLQKEKCELWENKFRDGMKFETQGAYDQALTNFYQAMNIDSMRADLHYHIGKCQYALADYGKAQASFVKANDLDVLRFRASDEFNDIIRTVGSLKGACVADLEKAFIENSPHGIIGSELIIEHLHPNVAGYFLMGKVFCKTIAEQNQIAPFAQWDWKREMQDSDALHAAAFTDVDVESANIRVKILTSAWPFHENAKDYSFTPSTPVQKTAFAYCQREITWEEAHYRMASYYQRQKQYDLASKEYETVAKELYLFYHPRMLVGDMKVLQGDYKGAEKEYSQALELDPNQFVHLRLGTLFLQQREIDQAILHLITAISYDREANMKFTQDVKIMAYLTLGTAYCTKGERTLAIDAFRQVIALDPKNRQASVMLRQLGVAQ